MIGVLLDRSVGDTDIFLRFTRIDGIISDIQEMVTKLQLHKSTEADSGDNTQ